MPKLTVTVLGPDCPGIIATVSKLMQKAQCNITNVSQTILAGEYTSIFMVTAPSGLDQTSLREKLQSGLFEAKFDLLVIVRPSNNEIWSNPAHSQPFVVTVEGKDQIGLIAQISNILFQYQVNVENMKAVLKDNSVSHALFLFEVMVPDETSLVQLRNSLNEQGHILDVMVSIQHRDIFEAIHRVLPV